MDPWLRLFAISLLVNIIIVFHADAGDSEVEALLNFKKSIDDPLASLSNWNRETGVCQWIGISCSSTGRIVGIQLDSLSLSGTLPFSTIQALPQLRNLSVSGNNLTNISISSSRKCSLQLLHLSRNHFTEDLLNTLSITCKNIRLLNLSHNKLRDISVKTSIGNSMVSVDLSYNKINVPIPASFFGSCKSLQFLDISSNQLAGGMPQDMFRNCRSLQELSLASNNLTGEFPALRSSNSLQKLNISTNLLTKLQIEDCTSLQELDVSFNNISGTVFWKDCDALKVLNLSDNHFSGPFLTVFGNRSLAQVFKFLEILQANHNSFTGELPTVPPTLESLDLSCNVFSSSNTSICLATSSLKSLVLVYNRLPGPVLSSAMSCGNLEMLDLSINSMTGSLPVNMFSRLPKLRHLLLWGNNLEGSIPATIGDCTELVTLDLSHNSLTGAIPEEICQLKNVYVVLLNNNMLSGAIPACVGSMLTLSTLVLGHNKLQGGLPSKFTNSSRLLVFLVNDNRFTGGVPGRPTLSAATIEYDMTFPFLAVVTINRQPSICRGFLEIFMLQGIRLHEFQQLPVATQCETFPFLLPPGSNLTSYSQVMILDLSYNSFTGTIPAELGGIKNLFGLSLAHNLLTGTIPPTFGKLKNLEWLDLSDNQLESDIPGSLGSLTFLEYFNVSHNQLSGEIPQSGQLPTFHASSYEGNPGLCGLPLAAECPGLHNPGPGLSQAAVAPPYDDHSVEDDGDEDERMLAGYVGGSVSFLLWSCTAFFCKSLEDKLKRAFGYV